MVGVIRLYIRLHPQTGLIGNYWLLFPPVAIETPWKDSCMIPLAFVSTDNHMGAFLFQQPGLFIATLLEAIRIVAPPCSLKKLSFNSSIPEVPG